MNHTISILYTLLIQKYSRQWQTSCKLKYLVERVSLLPTIIRVRVTYLMAAASNLLSYWAWVLVFFSPFKPPSIWYCIIYVISSHIHFYLFRVDHFQCLLLLLCRSLYFLATSCDTIDCSTSSRISPRHLPTHWLSQIYRDNLDH